MYLIVDVHYSIKLLCFENGEPKNVGLSVDGMELVIYRSRGGFVLAEVFK